MAQYGTGNLVSQSRQTDTSYLFVGFTTSQQTNFVHPTDTIPTGCDVGRGGVYITVGSSTEKVFVHGPGFSSAVLVSFTAGGTANPGGVVYDGVDIFNASNNDDKAFQLTGLTTTVQVSFAFPTTGNSDITMDSSGNLVCGHRRVADAFLYYSGFTSTVTNSILAPGGGTDSAAISVDFDESNFYTTDLGVDKIFQHTGFTTTIAASIAAPSTNPQGVAWDARDPQAPLLIASLHHVGMGSGV
jgi:hypothetical protein